MTLLTSREIAQTSSAGKGGLGGMSSPQCKVMQALSLHCVMALV